MAPFEPLKHYIWTIKRAIYQPKNCSTPVWYDVQEEEGTTVVMTISIEQSISTSISIDTDTTGCGNPVLSILTQFYPKNI